MKRTWRLILIMFLVVLLISSFLLTASFIGCGQAYSEADLDAARQATYEAGYAQGYSAGKAEGYDVGHNKGYDTGKADGYEAGHNEGYDAGLIELESVKQEAEKLGYDKGFEVGKAAGRLEALMERLEVERREIIVRPVAETLSDLAYIKTLLSGYSDDATPEPNGISLDIFFYDSKSKPITFKDIPLTVTIKLYEIGEWSKPVKGAQPLIYQDTVTFDSASSNMFGWFEIRIPFGDLNRSPTHYSRAREIWVQVTVTIPNQGDFSVTSRGGW